MLLHSHHSPPVRTSLLALSAIYEVYEGKILSNDRTTISLGSLHKHAFTLYAKAVAEIIQSLRSNTKLELNDRKMVLLSCLIFTWVEIMLSNFDTARWHLDSGLKIITDIAKNSSGDIERDDPDDIYGSLHRSFLRLKFQTTIGLDASPNVENSPSGDLRRTSHPANEIRSIEPVQTTPMINDGSQITRGPNVELTWTLQGRRRQLERLRMDDEAISRKPIHTIREEDRRRSLTFVYIKLSRAMLSLMTEARSNGPDTLLNSRYAEVVDIIEDIYNRKKLMQQTSASLDIGVHPPLFFTLKVSFMS